MGGIDTLIADEQARQRPSAPVSRTHSLRSPAQSDRNDSPGRPARKLRPKDYDGAPRGPDPVEFEKAFALEDDSEEPSRTSSPPMQGEKAATAESGTPIAVASAENDEKGEEKLVSTANRLSNGLPPEIRSKLRKLETLESKYKGL